MQIVFFSGHSSTTLTLIKISPLKFLRFIPGVQLEDRITIPKSKETQNSTDCSALWPCASPKIPQVASPPMRKDPLEQDPFCLAHCATFKVPPLGGQKNPSNQKALIRFYRLLLGSLSWAAFGTEILCCMRLILNYSFLHRLGIHSTPI